MKAAMLTDLKNRASNYVCRTTIHAEPILWNH